MSTSANERPTRIRYMVLATFISLAFITYLDRICMGRASRDIKRDFRFEEITSQDEARVHQEIANFTSRQGRAPTEEESRNIRKYVGEQLGIERFAQVNMAFQLGYVLFEVPGGWMGDRWGVRFVITRIVIWWSLFTALTGSADTVATLFGTGTSPLALVATLFWIRFLFGAGEAGAYPNISRATSRWFPQKDRARVQGTIWLASRWGGAISAVTYTILEAWFKKMGGDWRWVFITFGAVGIMWAFWFAWWYRNRPEEMPGVNQAECDLIRQGSEGAHSIYDDHSHAKVPWFRLYSSTNLIALYIAAFCSSFCWYFQTSQMPKYLESVFNASQATQDSALTAPGIGGGICCILGGVLSQWIIFRTGSLRWGRSLPGIAAFVPAATCMFLVPYFNEQRNVTMAIVLITICYTVQDLHMAVLWSLTSDIGGRFAGTLAGNLNMLGNFGGFLGLWLVPQVIRWGGTTQQPLVWDNVFWMNGCVYLIGAAMWLRINANEKLLVPESETQSTFTGKH